ncbi:MAG TPA: choice-of-anchor Q domain-containing protein [Candidatus Saccharimonadia bacterium]|nr:choice-of-anchor Q domain-containing protein [Candidatus Saccharimonadia bacterium]
MKHLIAKTASHSRSLYNSRSSHIQRLLAAIIFAGIGSYFLVLSHAATGTSYYITPTGSDSSACSLASPCKTIAHAATLLQPGDTLYARGGTYTGQENINWPAPSGTSTSPITFTNYPGETPVFDGQNISNDPFINGFNGISYTTVNGLTIQNYPGTGIWIGGVGCTDVSPGTCTTYSTNDTLSNNFILNTGTYNSPPANFHGIYVSYGNKNINISGNTIEGGHGAGIQFYHYPGTNGAKIYNNVIDGQNTAAWGIVVRFSTNVEIYNNTIINAQPYNSNGGTDIDFGASTNVTLRNNIVSLPFSGGSVSGLVCDHNMFIHDANGGATAANCGSSNQTAASGGFVNAGTGDYRLAAGSLAIDNGTTVPYATTDKAGTTRPQGSAYDIGAYEYQVSGGNCSTASASWQNNSITNQTGSFTFDFDATPSANGINAVTGLSNGAASAYTNLAAIVAFEGTGVIDAVNAGTYTADASVPYTAGTSYHFKLTVNIPAHTYSVVVTPAGGTPVNLATNYAFRTEQASVTNLNNWAIIDSSGSHTVCNVAVSTTGSGVIGDLNGDGHVNIFDLSTFLNHWQQSGSGLPEDFNSDGVVNIFDLSRLLSNYGT